MTHRNEYSEWDDNSSHSPEDELEPLSKSELKRKSAALQKLGEDMVHLTPAQLATIPLDDELADAVAVARKINRKKDGYRRQLQFIGKLLRHRDTEEIEQAMAMLNQKHAQQNSEFHALEKAREDIANQGDTAIQALLETYPELDRQKLRQFHRQIKKEKEKSAPPKAYRELFQYLKSTIGG
ncbi:ribosome biogenesis factor YjgA [Alteromonas sp. ASW11-130]|uniref:ribosome biogenesis factor YjgA n=1 Tax=Alteromonas sp. ASW11-130 TaxID=3015775 RepID=UPI002241C121|nr:ribosome biogenesis factor YjgA [Alteromonas sp. ASW11-130]MCW8091033.1 ribosome-associated protein [Alteromonas sp. ASW11-130]